MSLICLLKALMDFKKYILCMHMFKLQSVKLHFTEAQGKVNYDECANISVIALDSTISSCVLKTLQEVKYGKRQLNGPKRMMGVNSVPDDWVSPGVEAFVAVIGSVWSALSS